MEEQDFRTRLVKSTKLLFLLFSMFLALSVLLALTSYPIHVRCLEFRLDIPDEEFSTQDFSSARSTLEQHNYTTEFDSLITWGCNLALRISISENPKLRAWLCTECDSAVWGDTHISGRLEYPAYSPADLRHKEWTPLVGERMDEILSLLNFSPTSADIHYDDDDFGIFLAGLQFAALFTAFGLPIMFGILLAMSVVARRQLRSKQGSREIAPTKRTERY